MSDQAKRVRLNLVLDPHTRDLIEDYAAKWETDKGKATDRLVAMAVGLEATERQAEAGLGAMEEMIRRVLGDYTTQTFGQLRDLLEGPHIEASVARLLLFALIAHTKGERVAMVNEDAAVEVARKARTQGRFPQMPRPADGGHGKAGHG